MGETYDAPQTNRFKHQSYKQSLKDVHLSSTFQQTHLEHEVGDNDSHFHEAVDHWRQLNLAPSFMQFANKADPLSASMPLLLHNWKDIYTLWLEAFESADDEGFRALLDLLQKMAHDLRTTLSPIYADLLKNLLSLLPRSISPPALTCLLETLSSLFRYLLIPSLNLALLDQTWDAICQVLPKCLGEIQRAVAEVWGSCLRRMKKEAREKAVILLADRTGDIENASAWTLVFACKSISQTLHTCATSIFMPLLEYHLSPSANTTTTYTLIRRTLTALIHHVKHTEQFALLGDLIVQAFSKLLKSTDINSESDVERLRKMIEVVGVVCAVRQGSRLNGSQISLLFAELDVLPLTIPSLHRTLLRYVTALFVAADMPMWLGPGLKFLQRTWRWNLATAKHEPMSPEESAILVTFTLKFSGCLASSNWGGWKLVALPLLYRSVLKTDVDSKVLLNFLARLRRVGKVGGSGVEKEKEAEAEGVWKKVEAYAVTRLTALKEKHGREMDDFWTTEIEDILTLSPLFSSAICYPLIDIINTIIGAGPSNNDLGDGSTGPFLNSSHILGTCMHALATRDIKEWSGPIDVGVWTAQAVGKWAWSSDVLGGLLALARASPLHLTPVSLNAIYPSLSYSLLSPSQSLRLNTLRLLDSEKLINKNHQDPDVDGVMEVLKRCLQGEEVSVDSQGVRERVLRIGRVGQVVGDVRGAEVCTRWLIAQFKVNLRPLWSPAAAALASLSQRFGDVVWKLLFEEVEKFTRATSSLSRPEVARNGQNPTASPSNEEGTRDKKSDEDPWEDERSWRDPSAHSLRSVVIDWDDIQSTRAMRDQNQECFDVQSYEYQLLAALSECSVLAEKHNRELVPHFLALAIPLAGSSPITKLPKQKLAAWLLLFSKFTNPKALHSSSALYDLYINLLSHPDRSLQSTALTCLFTYKSPALERYEHRIRALLDDTRWRDELALFDLGLDSPDGITEGGLEISARKEVLEVIIRLLFGVMLEKKAKSKGSGAGDRRKAVLNALAGCGEDELGLLVDLMLRPFGWDRNGASSVSGSPDPENASRSDFSASAGDKQITGFLTLLGDVLKSLGSRLVRYWPVLIDMTIGLTSAAQACIAGLEEEVIENSVEEVEGIVDDSEDTVALPSSSPLSSSSPKIIRSIRQLGLKRFADFFRIPVTFDFSSYIGSAFASFIAPRLPALDRENTQSPSALLELFHVWTTDNAYAPFLVHYDQQTLPKIYDCLIATNVKPSVISRVFDIVDNLLGYSTENELIRESVLKPHVSHLLSNLAILVERTKGTSTVATPIVQRQLSILSEIAQYSTDSNQASTLLDLFSPLLRKPPKIVPEKVKVNLVKTIGNLMYLIPDLKDRQTSTYHKTYALLSQLFQSLRSRPARLSLITTFHQFATIDLGLQELAQLLEGMNAYSTKRMDEPDFDRRLAAFSDFNENIYRTISCSDWLPILCNMLSFIQDPVELSVRNSASYTMRRFIDIVAATETTPNYEEMFLRVLFSGLKKGLHSKNEMVRMEVLGVIAYSVKQCQRITSLQEMRPLLESGDEEANFFNNILHVQVHRRSRALRRLADHCEQGSIRSSILADIFIPLIGNYIMSTASVDHHLVNDAILATGRMAKYLSWGPYHALVQKYLKLSRARDESERVYVRALVALLENFHFPMEEIVPNLDTANEETAEDDGDEDIAVPDPVGNVALSSKTTARIADAVNLRLLPNLLNHLEKYDAMSDDNNRIPISIGIVTVAKHLPAAAREAQIARLVTILSQILRSKSQETRDLTRDALNRIAVNLGPSSLSLILRELRAALIRGPQLHVLAYVVHSLMVHVTSGERAEMFSTLDDCVNDVAFVSAEVIFGESGNDAQAEDFKTKMREVRLSCSRGLDSFAIVAKYVTPVKISSLLLPLKTIMQETSSIKVMNLVEEVLKRLAIGLNGNTHLVPTELLVLCHTLVSQNARILQQTPARRKPNVKGDAIVQVRRQVMAENNHYNNNSYRFVAFGLDLLNTALRRNRFDFHDSEVMKRLESMVVVIVNSLYSTSAPVLILGMRCAAGLVKCPLKGMEESLPVIIRQILDIIKQTGNTESELVQIAFKSLATVLRDGPPVQVKEKDLVYLIELLSPDLEEPTRQASVFTLLRAIVARKFVVPEIYDLMGKVSEVAVTSQSPQVQELCRGVLLQFLLDYPQGKGRLRNQMAFFAKNISYVHESGRTSIMALLDAVITKFQVNLVREYADLLFVALVMVVANDDSAKCREMGAQLIKNLFTRLDEDRRDIVLSHLHSWASQNAQPQLARVSAQVSGFIVDVAQSEALPYVSVILDDLKASLQFTTTVMTLDEDEDESCMDVELGWQLPYHVLTVLSKILRVFPTFASQDDKIAWNLVIAHLLFPHAWVRTAACRLLGILFSTMPVALLRPDLPDDHPLSKPGMVNVAKKLSQQLKSEHLDNVLSLQIVKNLFYVGKCFYLFPVGNEDEGFANGPAALLENSSSSGDQFKHLDNPLPWLFSKLSYQVKSGHIARRNRAACKPNWSQQPLASLRWFAAMASHMEAASLERFLVHILTPVYRLIDDDTIRDSQMEELKTTAVELQDLVQSKVGTTKFSLVYNQIRQSALGVRRKRKVARALQVTTNPEAAAKRKMQKNAIKKDSRKRKDPGFSDSKGKIKRRREE